MVLAVTKHARSNDTFIGDANFGGRSVPAYWQGECDIDGSGAEDLQVANLGDEFIDDEQNLWKVEMRSGEKRWCKVGHVDR